MEQAGLSSEVETKLIKIARLLTRMDWRIGYDLEEVDHARLDHARDLAFELKDAGILGVDQRIKEKIMYSIGMEGDPNAYGMIYGPIPDLDSCLRPHLHL